MVVLQKVPGLQVTRSQPVQPPELLPATAPLPDPPQPDSTLGHAAAAALLQTPLGAAPGALLG